MPKLPDLSRRERQALDVIYQMGAATANDVHDRVKDSPSYSAVRATLSALEKKGHVRVERDGVRYVYHPTVARDQVRTGAMSHVIDTFFGGSLAQAVTAMLDARGGKLTKAEVKELERRLRQAREEGR